MRVKQIHLPARSKGAPRNESAPPPSEQPAPLASRPPAPPTPAPSPLTFDDVQLAGELDREVARVKNLNLFIQGQPVTLSGEVPLGRNFWLGALKRKWIVNWEKASAQVKMQDAQIAGLASLLPKVLSPQGKLTVNVGLLPGGKLDGRLDLTGAATVPLGSFGVIREIDVK